MQYDILQYLSAYTIHICYTHIDDVNRSLSYIMFNYLTRITILQNQKNNLIQKKLIVVFLNIDTFTMKVLGIFVSIVFTVIQ